MTLADKKIAEFFDKFDVKKEGFYGFENWLRKALAEAEREGIRKELEREKYREKTEKVNMNASGGGKFTSFGEPISAEGSKN